MKGPERRRWLVQVSPDQFGGPEPKAEDDEIQSNPLLAFSTERPAADPPGPRREAPVQRVVKPRPGRRVAILAGALVFGAMVVGGARLNLWSTRAAPPAPGKLTLDTRPQGAQVTIDGIARGTTPLIVNLPAGAHVVHLRHSTDERRFPLHVAAGAEITQYLEIVHAEGAVAVGGKISVTTEPSGARVFIDDQPRGVSPVTVADLPAAEHKVAVTSATGAAQRIVSLEDNATASVFFSLPRVVAPLAGWLALTAPFEVRVTEGDRVLTIDRAATLRLTPGRHSITLTNDGLRYRETRSIQVDANQTTVLQIDPPKAPFSANANPWAEVIVDGVSLGQTPLANVLLPIGEHEVVFEHPELGQRRRTMIVTMKGTSRMSIDFTR